MNGYAEFKSHVLRRDEKGLFGIPFKRLLGCGLGGGGVMTVAKFLSPEGSVLLGLVIVVVLLIFTHPQQGIPRWRHLMYRWRWRLLNAATHAPGSFAGQAAGILNLPAGKTRLHAETLFHPTEPEAAYTTLTDWVAFTRPSAAGQPDGGLIVSARPGVILRGTES